MFSLFESGCARIAYRALPNPSRGSLQETAEAGSGWARFSRMPTAAGLAAAAPRRSECRLLPLPQETLGARVRSGSRRRGRHCRLGAPRHTSSHAASATCRAGSGPPRGLIRRIIATQRGGHPRSPQAARNGKDPWVPPMDQHSALLPLEYTGPGAALRRLRRTGRGASLHAAPTVRRRRRSARLPLRVLSWDQRMIQRFT